MRLLVISFAIALVFLLPALADLRQFELPYRGLIGIPAVLLEYPVVFLHEMGHTIARWVFGYLALPSLDFANGGGMKQDFKHSDILLYAVYALLFGAFITAIILKRAYGISGIIAIIGCLHLALVYGQGHQGAINYMGHGCELLAATFLVIWTARGETISRAIWQYLGMIFGLYLMGKNVILSLGLATGSEAMRHAYAAQKGVHVAGDFKRIAEMLGESVQSVAFYSMGATVMCAAAVVYLAVYLPATERLGSIR